MRKILLLGLSVSAALNAFASTADSSALMQDNKSMVYTRSSSRNTQSRKSDAPKWEPLRANFNVESNMLLSTDDATKRQWFGNTYVTGVLQNNWLEARMRFEELSRPMPGHEANKGRGIPHIELTGRYGNIVDLTLGDFYDQFGSGIVLRSYEERNLGIDNSIRGARITTRPVQGVAFKALVGQQRNYFDRPMKFFNRDRGFLTGFDLEFGIDRWFKAMSQSGTYLSLGGSFVTNHESSTDIPVTANQKLNLPENVPTMGARFAFQKSGFSLNGEYAYKYNAPTADNKYIYHDGSVAMLSTSYSKRGMSLLLQAKRSENFNYLSDRSALGLPLHINYLPPFSKQQTYSLAALYPYATQPGGEWAFQGEFSYTFKRRTALGGRYGTHIAINASHIRGLQRDWMDRSGNPISIGDADFESRIMGGNGYSASFFKTGKLYYQDINFEIAKKVTPTYSFQFTYLNQIYNKEAVQGHLDDYDLQNLADGVKHPFEYHTNVFIYDGKHKLSNKVQLRTELQYMTTKQGEGDWLFGLAEVSIVPGLMFTLSDQYNVGLTDKHYWMGSVAYTKGSQRIQLSAGRTRAGMNCSGGVCRLMPATSGIYLSYNGNF